MKEKFFSKLDKIDKLIEEGPNASNFAESSGELLADEVSRKYFFDQLSDSGWLRVFSEVGFFKISPELDGKEMRASIWFGSNYLLRMAESEAEVVVNIIQQLPDTEDVSATIDYIDIAITIPTELSSQLVDKAKNWAKILNSVVLPGKIGEFISHLSKGGFVKEAIELASVLLEVLPDPKAMKKGKDEQSYLQYPEPQARFDIWVYEEVFNNLVPDLVNSGGELVLILLCDLLERAVSYKLSNEEKNGPVDYSHIWRPTIKASELALPYGYADILVFGVRNAADSLIKTSGMRILEIVEGYSFNIFKRIGLYLRQKWPEADPMGTSRILTDSSMFDNHHLNPEFFRLLQDQFNNIPLESKDTYLNLIEEGFDIEEWLDSREEVSGQRPTPEEGEKIAGRWEYKKLWPIQECLDKTGIDSKWRKRFDILKKEFGELDHPEVVVKTETFWGPSSPKSTKELSAMTIDELVEYLKSWKQTGEEVSAEPEGLGRQLTAVVSSSPEKFVKKANEFKGLDPIYVKSILSGFQEAVKQNNTLQWSPIINLCQWVVDQPREIPGRKTWYSHIDPGWVWTRLEIARLLVTAFESDTQQIPFELRDDIWKVLQLLTDDPDPTPEYEKKYAGYGNMKMEPYTISINSTRGEAMHAVVRYAIWVRQNIRKQPDSDKLLNKGFAELKEVREILDKHLDLTKDPSLAIRAVYGWWFPQLVAIDRVWATNNAPKIFPSDEEFREYLDAAWVTYLTFCKLYTNVFEILIDQYSHAVDQIGPILTESRQLQGPEERLASHLMHLLASDKIKPDEPDSLLRRFFQKAPDSLRGFAMQQVGLALKNSAEKAIAPIMDKLKALWQWRLEEANSQKVHESYQKEMAAFGYWFISGRLDNTWAISQLKQALEIAGKVDPDDEVLERLTTVANEAPGEVVECLRLMVEGSKEEWAIHGWDDDARKILAAGLESGSEIVHQAAEDLVNRLGARGFLQYRHLLSSTGPKDKINNS